MPGISGATDGASVGVHIIEVGRDKFEPRVGSRQGLQMGHAMTPGRITHGAAHLMPGRKQFGDDVGRDEAAR